MFNAWLLAFFVEITAISVTERVDTEIPCTGTGKLRKCDRYVLPVCVDHNVDQVIGAFALIIACKAYSEGVGISWNGHIPCVNVMSVDIFHTAYCIGKLPGDNRVVFTEPDHKFEKFKKIVIFLQKLPVDP